MSENKQKFILIFTFLAFFSLSLGVWVTYSILWLEVHNITVQHISMIVGGATFLACLIALGSVFLFKKINTLLLIKICLVLKILAMLGLIFLFNSTLLWIITALFIVDAIVTLLIVLSVYPLITNLAKTRKLYSHRKLIEYLFTDIGLVIAAIVISFPLARFFEFNLLLIISLTLAVVSLILLLCVRYKHENKQFSLRRIYSDKILRWYQVYAFFMPAAVYLIFGMLALVVTEIIGLSLAHAVIFITVAHISGDIFGYAALYKLQFKNDYLTYSSKFWVRCILYTVIAITANFWVAIIGLFYSLFVSRAWEDVSDGVYINRVHTDDQLAFSNIRFGIARIGQAIGILICGLIFHFGMSAVFGVSAGLLAIANCFGFYCIYLRNKEKRQLAVDKGLC